MLRHAPRLLIVVMLALLPGCAKALQRQQQKLALVQARDLANKVAGANTQLAQLSDALRDASEALVNGDDPAPRMAAAAKVQIGFSAKDLAGGPLAALPAEVLDELLDYVAGIHMLERRRDKLVKLVKFTKPMITKHQKQKAEPTVRFSIMVRDKGGKKVAYVARHKVPFPAKGDWPDSYAVTLPSSAGGKSLDARRFGGGRFGDEHAIPLDERSSEQIAGGQMVLAKVRAALAEAKATIDGSKSPGASRGGLLDDGKALMETLNGLVGE